jgi:hypothetical protein
VSDRKSKIGALIPHDGQSYRVGAMALQLVHALPTVTFVEQPSVGQGSSTAPDAFREIGTATSHSGQKEPDL